MSQQRKSANLKGCLDGVSLHANLTGRADLQNRNRIKEVFYDWLKMLYGFRAPRMNAMVIMAKKNHGVVDLRHYALPDEDAQFFSALMDVNA